MANFVKRVLRWILLALPVAIAGGAIGWMREQGVPALIITALVAFLLLLLLLALLLYLFSDKIVLRWYHAKEDANSPLCKLAHGLASKADMPVPKIFIVESGMPNAFATGRNAKHAAIVVTTALTALLDKDELEAVLAHELMHVKRGDTRTGTIVAVLSGLLTASVTLAFWCSIFTGFGQEDDPAPNMIKFFVTTLVAPLAATAIQLAVPRSREYAADEQSVSIHGNADKLAGALQKIESRLKSGTDEVNPAHVHLFITNPLHNGEVTVMDFRLPTYHFLFRTHPATDERVERLMKMRRGNKDGAKRTKEGIRVRLLRPLFFSFVSYLFVLFAILVLDTFNSKDFIFLRAAAISTGYLGALILLFGVMTVVFRVKLKTTRVQKMA